MKTFISFSAIWGSQIVILVANLLTQAIFTRNFSPEDYGEFVSALSIITIFASLAAFGISQYWLKVFGREGLKAYRWMDYSRNLLIISTVIAVICCLLFVNLTSDKEIIKYTIFFIPIIICTAIYSILNSIFQLSRQYVKMSVFQTFMPISRLSMVLLFTYVLIKELSLIALGYGFMSLVLMLISIKYYFKFVNKEIPLPEYSNINYKDKNEKEKFSNFLKEVSPYGLLGVFYLIYYQIDIFMINIFDFSENAAFYSVAISILSAIYVFPAAIYQRFFGPQIHKWIYHDIEKVLVFYKIGNTAMIYLSSIIILGIGLIGEKVILGIFGESYYFSYEILILLSLSVPFRLLSDNIGTIFNTGNYVNLKLVIQGTAAFLNITLNYILLNAIGLKGAIIATVLTEMFVWISFRFAYFKKQKLSLKLVKINITPILLLGCTYSIYFLSNIISILIFVFIWLIVFIYLVKRFVKNYYIVKEN